MGGGSWARKDRTAALLYGCLGFASPDAAAAASFSLSWLLRCMGLLFLMAM